MQKIQESTKKEHNRYKAKRLKHGKDTVKEVVEALSNANFDKIQVYSTKDTEREMQKSNSIIEKESVTRKYGKIQLRTESAKLDSTNKYETTKV